MLPASLFSLIILTCVTVTTEFEHECKEPRIDCGNGRCISHLWRCDGSNDCGNMKDEENCENPKKHIKCFDYEFQCEEGNCIASSWHCDGERDCDDGSDERNCSKVPNCDGFRCLDNHCIPKRWECDGEPDCKDGSDENSCHVKKSSPCEGKFMCSAGSCVPLNKVCDGVDNCADGSDEGSHCADCKNKTCDQNCRPTPLGAAECFCSSGYELARDNITCNDVDECLEDGFCSQKCKNLKGSYECSCESGYLLNNRTCEANGPDPVLVYTTLTHIRGLYLRSNLYFPVHDAVTRSTAVDVDLKDSRVYWIDLSRLGASIYSTNLDGSELKAVISNGLLTPEDIAIDYIARNIYITDSGLKQVLVCRIDGSICHVLHRQNVDKPRSLALDSSEGRMYWSDWGNNTGIYRSGMDGSRRTTLVSTDIQWPNGIAIDHTMKKLYWCDARIYRIEYITLDGRKRKVVLQDVVFHPFSIAVFEDKLYWTDWDDFSLRSCNKFTGHNHTILIKENELRIMGVHVYHPVLSKESVNPCWMTMCSHICVITTDKTAKCACPPGFTLSNDICLNNGSPQLFITGGSAIFHMQPEAVGNDIIKKLPIDHVRSIGDLAYNWKTRNIFVSDKESKEILQIDVDSLRKTVLIKNHVGSVEDLAYDWLGDNLFWVDSIQGSIEVLSLNKSSRVIVVSNLTRPLAIILAPENGLMFISVVGGQPYVAMYHMDGTNKKILAAVTGLPLSLSLHPKDSRLYWADPKTETISSIDYLKPSLSKKVHKRQVSHVTSVTVSEKFIYWVDSQRNQINLMNQEQNRSILHTLTLPGNESSAVVIRKVNFVYIPVTGSRSACSLNNGGCSDICLTKQTGRICACPVGKTLRRNGKDCTVSTTCTANQFKCKSTSTCLPRSYKCDGTSDCEDQSDEDGCELSRCPERDFQCRNGRCILTIWKCDEKDDCGDGSDEEGCDTSIECASKKFRCGDGLCIPDLWRCDGEVDCKSDHLDEENCRETECHENQFRCDRGQCLPSSWVCDGTNDCSDGTDENPDKCGKSLTCRATEFRCGNGICIDKAMKCDHRNDCEDNSDEMNCAVNSTCREGMFKCGDGTCIYPHEICDGHDDCDNDEVNCSSRRECSGTEFLCSHTNRCIPRQWVCDNDDDCGDRSDEDLNICHHKSTTTAPPPRILGGTCDQFTCASGDCVPLTKVCNGIPDCLDYSDEGQLCATSCGKTNGGCSHLCSPSPKGARCSCLAGYKLLPDQKTCDDENECLIAGLCSQFCNNTKGGFKCSCAEGYFLSHDHRKCKADGGPATLVYLLPDQIRALDLSSHSQKLYMQGDRTDIRGLDYDAADGVFFWSEWKEGTLNKFNIGSNRNDIIVHDIKRPYYVKWDWIAKNIYYTNGEASIMACSKTGEFCTVVVKSIAKNVNSFELVPGHGIMFWTVWNEVRDSGPGIIEKSHMDGSGRITVLSDKIYWPTSITVDSVLETIYWTDVKLQIMESADFHGLNRKVVVQDGMYYPFSMTIFEDNVYWADWGTDTILRCNKFKPGECLHLHKGDVKAETMLVVHKVKQPQSHNRCLNSKCPQMCLQKEVGFSCRCDRKFNLVKGGCVPKVTRSEIKPKLTLLGCDEKFCHNGGECSVIEGKRTCSCPASYKGVHCEILEEEILPPHDYSWVVAVLLGIFAVIAIILVILICRQHRSKISKLGDSVAVSFRNPRCFFRKKGIITDTDDATPDELMLGKKGAYTQPGFGNPLFNQRPYMDPAPEDGDYKRWPSYDSDDSAFVSEYYSREDSSLTLDQTSMSSKERIIQFFRRI